MKGFFTDQEVCKFSFEEKITYIFNQLDAVLQPSNKVIRHTTFHDYSGKSRRIKYITCNIDENNISFVHSIELPFTNISVKNEKNIIKITGENFCYMFPADMLPYIWYHLKKAL